MEQPVITSQPVPPNELESDQFIPTRLQIDDDDAKSDSVDNCCCHCEEPQRNTDFWSPCYTFCWICRCFGQFFELMGQCLEGCLVWCAECACDDTECCGDSCCCDN